MLENSPWASFISQHFRQIVGSRGSLADSRSNPVRRLGVRRTGMLVRITAQSCLLLLQDRQRNGKHVWWLSGTFEWG